MDVVKSPKEILKLKLQFGCIDSAGETPSYISNLEVKSCCGEGSAWATVCENSKMHPLLYLKPLLMKRLFFCLFFANASAVHYY